VAIPLCGRCGAELGPETRETCPACGEPRPRVVARREEQEFKQGLRRSPAAAPVGQGPPDLPGDVAQFYLPVDLPDERGRVLVYHPRVLGFADVVFADRRKGLEHRRQYHYLAEVPAAGQPVNWATARVLGDRLAAAPEAGAHWREVPEALASTRKLKTLERGFADFLYASARLVLLTNRGLNLVGQPGEDVVAFKARCRAAARQEADKAVAAEKPRYSAKFEALHSRLPEQTPQDPGREVEKHGSLWNPLGWLFLTGTGESKPAAPAVHLSARDQARLAKLETDWRARVSALYEKWLRLGEDYAELLLTPRKSDIRTTHFGLAWEPVWQQTTEGAERGKGETAPRA
jgi:hypothetical protein